MQSVKREVDDIKGEEPTSAQPAGKMEEGPVPSTEVAELQQQLAKSEEDKQRAIRIAGEAQARVEFLENLIDEKPAPADDTNDDSTLVEEQQKKIDDLSRQLAQYEAQEQLPAEPQPPQAAQQPLVAAPHQPPQHAQAVQLQLQPPPPQPLRAVQLQLQPQTVAPVRRAMTARSPTLDALLANIRRADRVPTLNIFDVRPAFDPQSMWIMDAINGLLDLECSAMDSLGFTRQQWPELRKRLVKSDTLRCESCQRTFKGVGVLDHFYSWQHIDKVGTLDTPLLSFNHWVRKLESIAIDQTAAAEAAEAVRAEAAARNG